MSAKASASNAPRRFVLTYALIAGTLLAVYCMPYAELGVSERWFDAYLSGYAKLVGALLSLFEPNVVVSDSTILGRYSLRIVKNCDAMEIEILLVSALLALPGVAIYRRGVAALAAAVSVVLINVLRIFSLYYVGLYFPAQFERMHLEVWPFVLVTFAAIEFLLVARFLQKSGGVDLTPPSARAA